MFTDNCKVSEGDASSFDIEKYKKQFQQLGYDSPEFTFTSRNMYQTKLSMLPVAYLYTN